MTDLPPPLTPPPAAHLHPRIVPWQHALAWYEDAMRLFKRGPATWLTLERNMACGVGTCGHCQLGPFFVCRDGPVFSVLELGSAFGREGL